MAVIQSASSTQGLLPSRYGELKSEDFVKLIFTELRNQDPFKPNDSSELLKQIDSIRSIQANMELGDQLQQMTDASHLNGASDLLGRFVKGLSTDYQMVSGTVIGVQPSNQGALLELDNGSFLPTSFIQQILGAPPAGTGS